MITSKILHVVSCHAEGEVGDVIVGGATRPLGRSIREQAAYLAKDETLRNFLLREPRGGVFRHVNLLVPPFHPDAQFGWIVMEPEDTPPMSGSNAMCVVTVLLETGLIPMQEPISEVTLEAPGGLIKARASCAAGKVRLVTITNVASFMDRLDAPVEVAGYGTLSVDLAFGGDSFALVEARRLGFELKPDEARDLAVVGRKVVEAVNEQIRFDADNLSGLNKVSFCQLTGPVEPANPGWRSTSAVIIRPGKVDRSPCGTGCSARMAVLRARNSLQPGEVFVGRSILGSQFECRVDADINFRGRNAIIPSISGRAWITGIHQHTLDPDDPWPNGYQLADTWPRLFN